jgi:hypothetical protein
MRVVCGVPAGRRRYMELLFPHLLVQKGIDEYQIWAHTQVQEDLDFMAQFCARHPGRFRMVPMPEGERFDGPASIRHFIRPCNDPDTLYIRVDDDVVWMAEDCLETLVRFRLENPDYFLVFANVVNNNVCSFIHQHLGLIPRHNGVLEHSGNCWNAFANFPLACDIHESFIRHYSAGRVRDYAGFSRWEAPGDVRVCINLISWFGRDLPSDGRDFVEPIDEMEMAVRLPKELGRLNAICGDALALHFSYGTQLEGLPEQRLLAWYRQLAPVQNPA